MKYTLFRKDINTGKTEALVGFDKETPIFRHDGEALPLVGAQFANQTLERILDAEDLAGYEFQLKEEGRSCRTISVKTSNQRMRARATSSARRR